MEITFKKVQKKHLPLLKELAKSLHLEIEEESKSPYNKEFVAKVLKGEQDLKDGKGVIIPLEDIWK
ncbi:DUF2683 family protein [Flavobacterium aquatile]|uniref:Uncharacterized protein n=1 Tax=Flavobacterium aquatile LMG 4008 = ATCC 11947 TaxID=1453498 RepID=A0A095TZ98_9FLAO|nr:DUF2683 family protein [Flavobacterium aquatile]KGD67698.1 hypothetical protein LG45_11290 [Flavobacterium aquatile LMG 4008 = ATCC 11947]OXA67562.1 hypothetical protein B0A61_07020 [Flavobacterium aquatile LMG 4008 = ATCC 11947]GEC78193.1 hypothetical protein FAQ01_10630 [Flavobacterium aquatile]